MVQWCTGVGAVKLQTLSEWLFKSTVWHARNKGAASSIAEQQCVLESLPGMAFPSKPHSDVSSWFTDLVNQAFLLWLMEVFKASQQC